MSNVARALDEVRVLQLAVTVRALELRPPARPRHVIAPVAGAGHLVTPGARGRRSVLKVEVLINDLHFITPINRVHVLPVPEQS